MAHVSTCCGARGRACDHIEPADENQSQVKHGARIVVPVDEVRELAHGDGGHEAGSEDSDGTASLSSVEEAIEQLEATKPPAAKTTSPPRVNMRDRASLALAKRETERRHDAAVEWD